MLILHGLSLCLIFVIISATSLPLKSAPRMFNIKKFRFIKKIMENKLFSITVTKVFDFSMWDSNFWENLFNLPKPYLIFSRQFSILANNSARSN